MNFLYPYFYKIKKDDKYNSWHIYKRHFLSIIWSKGALIGGSDFPEVYDTFSLWFSKEKQKNDIDRISHFYHPYFYRAKTDADNLTWFIERRHYLSLSWEKFKFIGAYIGEDLASLKLKKWLFLKKNISSN